MSRARLLREPLLHFLVLGALLFALYGWLNRDALRSPDEVVVDRGQVQALVTQFERVWQRAADRGRIARPGRPLGARGDHLSAKASPPAWNATTKWCAAAWSRR